MGEQRFLLFFFFILLLTISSLHSKYAVILLQGYRLIHFCVLVVKKKLQRVWRALWKKVRQPLRNEAPWSLSKRLIESGAAPSKLFFAIKPRNLWSNACRDRLPPSAGFCSRPDVASWSRLTAMHTQISLSPRDQSHKPPQPAPTILLLPNKNKKTPNSKQKKRKLKRVALQGASGLFPLFALKNKKTKTKSCHVFKWQLHALVATLWMYVCGVRNLCFGASHRRGALKSKRLKTRSTLALTVAQILRNRHKNIRKLWDETQK